ncbi:MULTISPECIES: helix-turn-helix transcriptional regulator [unclassified Pseudovibrio]|uniref:helix-turn-helix transcriptional regulator n=1 Tax=unclassified Pseudovibrio TaxID=2627060 RepID=UPI0007AE6811|nr:MULTISPECIES: helix-turn-helix transcriptional regulator [unclassified Pseudovibrio]KZL02809.1 HTH-type transcriptional regulator Xre [Pseudovibrio sp. W74]KZL07512.1 HTH-type transcriptional regulator Xre [Pseudovibrio sp. Ad14]
MEKAAKQYESIGNRLRLIRDHTGLTQQEFAEKHGFNRARYNHWETGLRRISLDCAYKIRETYDITLDYIYLGREAGLPQSFIQTISKPTTKK